MGLPLDQERPCLLVLLTQLLRLEGAVVWLPMTVIGTQESQAPALRMARSRQWVSKKSSDPKDELRNPGRERSSRRLGADDLRLRGSSAAQARATTPTGPAKSQLLPASSCSTQRSHCGTSAVKIRHSRQDETNQCEVLLEAQEDLASRAVRSPSCLGEDRPRLVTLCSRF